MTIYFSDDRGSEVKGSHSLHYNLLDDWFMLNYIYDMRLNSPLLNYINYSTDYWFWFKGL